MAKFTVAGFDVDQLLGSGWGGELWAARGRASGRPVVLRRLPVADDVASHDRARRAAARLVDVHHPHLVRLRGVLSTEGAVVLVHDQVAGVSLERRLADHGPLVEAEVVTLAVPLAQALAAVHACGLAHGRVSASSVLLSEDGRPMLADAGVAGLLAGCYDINGDDINGDHVDGHHVDHHHVDHHHVDHHHVDHHHVDCQADDVRDLALICRAALGPDARPGALADVIATATVDDPARRPSAAELAAAVFAAGPAAPIQPRRTTDLQISPDTASPGGEPPRSHRPHSHRQSAGRPSRRASRRWAGLLVTLGAMAAAALTGLAWADVAPGAPGSSVATREHGSQQDATAVAGRWRSVLVGLDAQRASAFAAASSTRLADVYAADAPALRRDRAQLADLAATGLHVEGLRLRPRSVRVVTSSSRRVVLHVVDVLEPYVVRSAHGALVDARPGRGAASWQVTLERDAGDWRVYDVVAG
jgi:Protein kinase domain